MSVTGPVRKFLNSSEQVIVFTYELAFAGGKILGGEKNHLKNFTIKEITNMLKNKAGIIIVIIRITMDTPIFLVNIS